MSETTLSPAAVAEPAAGAAGTGRKPAPRRAVRATPLGERFVAAFLFACGALSIFTTLGILGVLGYETAAFFSEVSIVDFLGDTEWTPLFAEKRFGIWALVSGTVLTSLIAMAVALPFGLLSAVYLSELAPSRTRRILKPLMELLAGVPTIVYGFFALTVVTPLLQAVIPDLAGFNALGAGIVMGVMIIPMIASLSEDAIHAVPRALREAAWGLGASSLSTIFGVVLPAARSGIAAATTLAISRAIGETMIVAIAAGQQPRFTFDPRVPVETMTAYIVQISMGDVPTGTLEFRTIFAVGAALFLLTFVMNVFAQRLARKYRRLG
jgi:phosphate transport system permease protein